jgi:hypothetical protein
MRVILSGDEHGKLLFVKKTHHPKSKTDHLAAINKQVFFTISEPV